MQLVSGTDIQIKQSGNNIYPDFVNGYYETLPQILNEYSETDEIIIGKWINDKPIYRKVFNFTMPSSNSTATASFTTYEENDIEEIVDVHGFFYIEDNAQGDYKNWRKVGESTFPIGDLSLLQSQTTRFMASSAGNISFQRTPWEYNLDVYATVEYTKTTD